MAHIEGGLRKRQGTYVVVPTPVLEDERLSFKAKGLLCYLLNKPVGWVVKREVIARQFPDGRTAIESALRELRAAGYYVVVRTRSGHGQWVTYTDISDTPVPEWVDKAERDFS